MSTDEVIKCAKEEFQPIETQIIKFLKQVESIDSSNFRTKPNEIVNNINTLLKEAETKIDRAKGVYKNYKEKLELSVQKTSEMANNTVGMRNVLNEVEETSRAKIMVIQRHDGDIEIFIKHTRIIVEKISNSVKFFKNTPFSDEDAATKLKEQVLKEIAQFPKIDKLLKEVQWLPTFTSDKSNETVQDDPREIKKDDSEDIKDLEKKIGL
jgi:Txe/YoeB family toxin of Txe-Axe toxin-antitoxin module